MFFRKPPPDADSKRAAVISGQPFPGLEAKSKTGILFPNDQFIPSASKKVHRGYIYHNFNPISNRFKTLDNLLKNEFPLKKLLL